MRRKLKQAASKRQPSVSAGSWEAAQYFLLWTSLPPSFHRRQVLEMYRSRRQIELALKRMKSIMGLGHLPQKDPARAQAWLHGRMYTSLLVERLIGAAKTFSPGDTNWPQRRSRWRETEYMLREIHAAISGCPGLRAGLHEWPQIAA